MSIRNDIDTAMQYCDETRVYDGGAGYLVIEQHTPSASGSTRVVAIPFDRLEEFLKVLKRHLPVS